jgi:hypothetical protein
MVAGACPKRSLVAPQISRLLYRLLRLIPAGLDPDSCGIGVASVPAQKASGSFLKKRTKKLFTLKRYADRNTYAK